MQQELQSLHGVLGILHRFVQTRDGRKRVVGPGGVRSDQIDSLVSANDFQVVRSRAVRFRFFVESRFRFLSGPELRRKLVGREWFAQTQVSRLEEPSAGQRRSYVSSVRWSHIGEVVTPRSSTLL